MPDQTQAMQNIRGPDGAGPPVTTTDPPSCTAEPAAKKNFEGLADEYKREIEAAENANKRCTSPRPKDYYDQQTGCDRKKVADLDYRIKLGERRMADMEEETKKKHHVERTLPLRNVIGLGPRTVETNEYWDMTREEKQTYINEHNAVFDKTADLKQERREEVAKCNEAFRLMKADPCSQAEVDRRNALIGATRAKLASVNHSLQNVKRCEAASRPAKAPGIDPSTVIQGLGGIGTTRTRPTQRTSPPPSSGGHKD